MMYSRGLVSAATLRRAATQAPYTGAARLSTSRFLLLKESSNQTDADYESHKQDSLRKQKAGQAEWKRELSSDSEEAVKADRQPHSQEAIKKLQEQTKKSAEAEKGK